MNTIIRAGIDWQSFGEIGLYAWDAAQKVRITKIEVARIEESDPSQLYSPVIMLKKDAAQVLMDDLWTCGIRPTEGTGSAGSLKATQDHLADLRKIAFKRLDIP